MGPVPRIFLGLGLILALGDCPGARCESQFRQHSFPLAVGGIGQWGQTCSTCQHTSATASWSVVEGQTAQPGGTVVVRFSASCNEEGPSSPISLYERSFPASRSEPVQIPAQGVKDSCGENRSAWWVITAESETDVDLSGSFTMDCPVYNPDPHSLAPSAVR